MGTTETRQHNRNQWLGMGAVAVLVLGALFLAYRDRIERCGSLRGACATTTVNVNLTATPDATTNEAAGEPVLYTDEEFPFQLRYSSDWTTTRNATGEGEERIVNIVFKGTNEGISVVIVDAALEGVVRESYSIQEEASVTMNGNPAQRLRGASAKDGSRLDLLLFTKDGTVYVLNGPAALLDSIGATVTFTST